MNRFTLNCVCLVCCVLGLLSTNIYATANDECEKFYRSSKYEDAFISCQKACNHNDGEGCFYLGKLYYEGMGERQDFSQAKIYYEKACSFNDGEGCVHLGLLYYYERQDYSQAKIYYEKACNLNHDDGCLGLGLLYDEGRGVRQNKNTAKEYFGKACDLGQQIGCELYQKNK